MHFSFVLAALAGVVLAANPAAGDTMKVMDDFRGIAYTEAGRPVGMPMGGIGAGSIEISSQGTLMEFRNVNNWCASLKSIPGSALWLTYRTGGETQVFPLSGGRVRFEGNFPFAKLTFPDLPVDVTLWCWSPFVMHDVRRSAYPAAIFDARITNTGKEKADIGLVLSYGTGYGDWLEALATGGHGTGAVRVISTAAPYSGTAASGISFTAKASADDPTNVKLAEIRKELRDAYLRAYDFQTVDISSVCNRSYLNQPFGSDPANAPLSFADLKPGDIRVFDTPFHVLDDAATGGKSMIMAVGGAAGRQSVTIPINRKADCLFFLGNCAGWAGGANSGCEYVIRYKDGSSRHVPLRNGFEISDWTGASMAYSPAQLTGKSQDGRSYTINLFAVVTDGSKEIDSVVLSQYGSIAPMLFALTTGVVSKTPYTEGVAQMRETQVNRMAGSENAFRLISKTDAGYALTARKRAGGEVVTYRAADPESLKRILADGRPVSEDSPSVYAVEQRFSLAPGKKAEAGLVCAWYAPNHSTPGGRLFGHKYEDWFADASAVAEEIARDHDDLLRDTKRHYDVIATSTLPKWYREMVQSNFYLLPACTWLTRDGLTFMYETPDGCPCFGTMDVRYYGSLTMLAAFPELDKTVLRQYRKAQKPDGFIPHDLGGSAGLNDAYSGSDQAPESFVEPSKNRADYEGFWVNLPIKYCLQVARDYQWTGDKEFLREMWPSVKQAIKWIDAQDEDRDGLPETSYGYDGWRMIDKCGYDANQWAAMLVAVARLARDLGEPEYAASLVATHKKAVAQIEKLIWTGSYYKQSATGDGGGLDWVSILQVAGSWYADMLGFDEGLSRDRVTTALKTMDDILGKDAVHGLYDALQANGSLINWWICDGQAIGWQYFYASHCMYRGLDDQALRVADEIWRQFTVEKARIPWCQEEFVHDPKKGECPYWLTRDMRMGSAMAMAYAAAGVLMDVPAGTAAVRPAEWVWKDSSFTLPVTLPKWLGQVKHNRKASEENWEITNLLSPVVLKSFELRTQLQGAVGVTISGHTRRTSVHRDGTVDVGPIKLGKKLKINIRTAQYGGKR